MTLRQRSQRRLYLTIASTVFVSLVVTTVPTAARAQAQAQAAASGASSDSDRAAELKRRADAAMDRLNHAEALALYVEAYAITKDPALVYNQGRAFEALDDLPSAIDRLEKFRTEASPELRARVPGLDARIVMLRARVATLDIRVNVDGARVMVRDKVIGTAPLAEAARLKPGLAVIEASRDGFLTAHRVVDLKGGATAVVDLVLLSKNTSGVLAVAASVPGATVKIDDVAVGNAPTELPVAAGSHSVDVDREGYRHLQARVVVAAGETKRFDAVLEKEGTIFGKWWFWTGVGVVLAGGVVTVIALTTERRADEGSLAPGRVSGPLVSF